VAGQQESDQARIFELLQKGIRTDPRLSNLKPEDLPQVEKERREEEDNNVNVVMAHRESVWCERKYKSVVPEVQV
jgi:hypothetical protein